MNDHRRYGDDEIRQIFERAGSTEGARQRTETSSEGLTLAELQAIAEEVGLSPVRIAEAAATLDVPSATQRRNRLGMPVSVFRTVANGTLYALIEPTEIGCRIRLGSSRPGAALVSGVGFAWILAAAITLLTLVGTGDLAGGNAFLPPLIGAVGVGTILYNGNRLQRWVGKWTGQVDYIVNRARSLLGGEPDAPLPLEPNHAVTEHNRPQRPLG